MDAAVNYCGLAPPIGHCQTVLVGTPQHLLKWLSGVNLSWPVWKLGGNSAANDFAISAFRCKNATPFAGAWSHRPIFPTYELDDPLLCACTR